MNKPCCEKCAIYGGLTNEFLQCGNSSCPTCHLTDKDYRCNHLGCPKHGLNKVYEDRECLEVTNSQPNLKEEECKHLRSLKPCMGCTEVTPNDPNSDNWHCNDCGVALLVPPAEFEPKFPPQAITEWEEEFDKKWGGGLSYYLGDEQYDEEIESKLKDFIRTAIAEAEQRGYKEEEKLCKKIGDLERQVIIADKQGFKEGTEAERNRIREVIYKDGVPEKYYKNSEQFRAGFSTALDYLLDLINKKDVE